DAWVGHPPSSRMKLPTAVNLEQFPERLRPKDSELENALPQYHSWTFDRLLMLLKLIAQGKTVAQGVSMLWLPPDRTPELEHVLYTVGSRMWYSQKKGDEEGKAVSEMEFLCRITDDGWARLIEHSRTNNHLWTGAHQLIDELPYMVGPTRQVLLQHDHQFELIHSFLESMQMPKSLIRVTQSGDNSELSDLAKQFGFKTLTPSQAGTDKRPFRLDPFREETGNRRRYNRDYCSLTIIRNREQAIRSSFDLTVALLAFASASQFAHSTRSNLPAPDSPI
ncbi:MAG: hypothetical protein OQK12_17800, partial [Motiliproteus sp.]|nr:hypothetical protein [Motiliproteus sp.]